MVVLFRAFVIGYREVGPNSRASGDAGAITEDAEALNNGLKMGCKTGKLLRVTS